MLSIAVFALGFTTLALHGRVDDLEVALSRAEVAKTPAPPGEGQARKSSPRAESSLRARLELFSKDSVLKTEEMERVHMIMTAVYERTETLGAGLKAGNLNPAELRDGVKEARQVAEADLVDLLGNARFSELRNFLSAPRANSPGAVEGASVEAAE
jgi:hypothetical protein